MQSVVSQPMDGNRSATRRRDRGSDSSKQRPPKSRRVLIVSHFTSVQGSLWADHPEANPDQCGAQILAPTSKYSSVVAEPGSWHRPLAGQLASERVPPAQHDHPHHATQLICTVPVKPQAAPTLTNCCCLRGHAACATTPPSQCRIMTRQVDVGRPRLSRERNPP